MSDTKNKAKTKKEPVTIDQKHREWITNMILELDLKPSQVSREQNLNFLAGDGEKVKVKKLGIESKDLGFQERVKLPIQNFIGNHYDSIKEAKLTPVCLCDSLDLCVTLVHEKQSYEGKQGKSTLFGKRKDQQRNQKMTAIDKRLSGLMGLVDLTPKTMVQYLIPEEPDEKKLEKPLDNRALDLAANYTRLIINDEDTVTDLLTDLVGRQLRTECEGKLPEIARKTLMRSNTALSSCISEYRSSSETGKQFTAQLEQIVADLLPDEKIVIHENKLDSEKDKNGELINRSPKVKQEIIESSQKALVIVCNQVLNKIIGMPIPAPIKAAAVEVASQALGNGIDDERDISIAVGGIVILRFVNPVITNMSPREKDPNKAATLLLISIVLQRLANGTTLDQDKGEAFIDVLKALAAREKDVLDWMYQIAVPN